ncbi:hypothetical protein [Nostoc sp.]|uniref:hypothetical protein n=1 Tax=Nostoc sp. TaxID=1180 RepID=UPI002FF37082
MKWIVEARYKNIVDFIYIAVCIEVLAVLRFEKDLIWQFLREDIMKESVIYQDIVQKEAALLNQSHAQRF